MFIPVSTRTQTHLKSLCKQISVPHPCNVRRHGGFGCLGDLFYPSVTLRVPLSALYAELSNLCICREPRSLVSHFKFTETSRTVAWPRSPYETEHAPASSARSRWNISLSHGCKPITQQCFEVALDRFVFAWIGWALARLMSRRHTADGGRLSLHVRPA